MDTAAAFLFYALGAVVWLFAGLLAILLIAMLIAITKS